MVVLVLTPSEASRVLAAFPELERKGRIRETRNVNYAEVMRDVERSVQGAKRQRR